MNKILILGDSSIPPREELSYDKTYSSMLKKEYSDVNIEVYGKTGNNSKWINSDLDAFMLYGYNPNIVILNYGIVDVYPRPYPNMIYRLFSCTGFLPYIDQFLKKTKLYYKMGDLFNFKEVSVDKFEVYSQRIIQRLLDKKVKKIIIIGIIKPYKILLRSKKVEKEVVMYNQVFQALALRYEEVNYIDMYNESDEEFTIWDGYHYSAKASVYLASKIKKILS